MRLLNHLTRLSILAGLSALSWSCAAPPATPTDAVRPADLTARVDFRGVFGRTINSVAIVVPNREAGLMRRVMISPNIAFESSRSSTAEPPTTGPDAPTSTSPNLPNALGTPVSIQDSSRLIRYLVDHSSFVIAPVVSRVWCGGADDCPAATWVERVVMMARSSPQSASTDTMEPGRFSLPTSMLAVRRLGLSMRVVSAVVALADDRRYVVRISEQSSEPSLCPDLRITVPMVSFSGEVISALSGQIVARFDEDRTVGTEVSLERDVRRATWTPVYGATPYSDGVHRHVESWTERSVLCESITSMFGAISSEISVRSDVTASVRDMISSVLDPLYRSEREPSRRAATPPPAPVFTPEPVAIAPEPSPTVSAGTEPAPASEEGGRRRRRRQGR